MTTHIPSLTLPAQVFSQPAASILLPILLGDSVGFVVRPRDAQRTYLALKQPPYRPPPQVFAPVWTALYGLMGYAAYRAWDTGLSSVNPQTRALTKQGATLYTIQLGLNLIWMPLFFGLERPIEATADIVLLTGTTGYLTYIWSQVDTVSAWCLAPYLGWLGFATYLSAGTGHLNDWNFKDKETDEPTDKGSGLDKRQGYYYYRSGIDDPVGRVVQISVYTITMCPISDDVPADISPSSLSNGTSPDKKSVADTEAAFDFRSDVVTRPTPSMMRAIANATLQDDVFQEDPNTNSLQDYVAHLVGHEAALFVTSGTMGNQLCIRTHLMQPPHSLLADASSHIMCWEAGGIAQCGAFGISVRPENKHHLTLADIKANTVLSEDIHHCPTRLICLENTLDGTILPLSDCREISEWAHSHKAPIRLHLDGARLWEAVASGAGSLRDYAACFDSMSLCFSKGLGAPIGSIIVGSRTFVERARHIRKSLGGGMRQTGILTAPARIAIDETFLSGRLKETHALAKEIASTWQKKGGRLQYPCETNMVWFDLVAAGITKERFVEIGLEHGVKLLGGRLVIHYQIRREAINKLSAVMDSTLGSGKNGNTSNETSIQAEAVMAPQME